MRALCCAIALTFTLACGHYGPPARPSDDAAQTAASSAPAPAPEAECEEKDEQEQGKPE